MPLFGNIIFHAFAAPYVGVCFAPWLVLLVLAVEAAVLWAWNRRASFGAICGCAAGMNAASYLVGFVVSPWLFVGDGLTVVNPDETGRGMLTFGPDWQRLARLAFLQACAVSAAVEVTALLAVRWYSGVRRVVVPVVVGNAASYAILYAGFVAVFGRAGLPAG